jgi:hypothetical protein
MIESLMLLKFINVNFVVAFIYVNLISNRVYKKISKTVKIIINLDLILLYFWNP